MGIATTTTLDGLPLIAQLALSAAIGGCVAVGGALAFSRAGRHKRPRAEGDSVTGVAQGLALGPFFGWKTTSHAGFTFEVQGGVEIVTAGTQVTDSSGGSTSSDVEYVPLLNLNIGWSF